MKLLKDLGMIRTTPTSKRKHRFGIYECSICGTPFKARADAIKTAELRNQSGVSTCENCKDHMKCIGRGATWLEGESRSKLGIVYKNMLARCYNKNHGSYQYYGGRGVKVCEEWLESYAAFKTWALNNAYAENLQLDKDELSSVKNIYPPIYSPGTCQFVTAIHNNSLLKHRL